MRISGELFLLTNTLANSLSLWLAARLMGMHLPSIKRILIAALCGSTYSVLAYLPGLSFLRTLPFLLVVPFVMAKIMLPHQKPLSIVKTSVFILLCGLFLGGFLSWLNTQRITLWPAFGTLFLSTLGAALFCGVHRKSHSQITMVEIALDGGGMGKIPIRLPAMLDTGNQLTDPITGLPVVVASSTSLRPILPAAVMPEDPLTLPYGFRLLRVQTTAGHKMMMCFRPSCFRVQMEGAWREGQALIAIAPTGYDGAQALVPSAVVEAL